MTRPSRITSPRPAATTIIVVALALLATACNWSQYGFDARHSGFNPLERAISPSNVSGLQLRWQQQLGGQGADEGPLVDGTTVYAHWQTSPLLSGSAVSAFDASSGTPRWTREAGVFFGRDGGGFGPIVAGGLLFTTAFDETTGASTIRASDLDTGQPRWVRDAVSVLVDQLVIDGDTLFESGRNLDAYDAATGRHKWSVGNSAWGGIAVAGGLVYSMAYWTSLGWTLQARDQTTGTLRWLRATTVIGAPTFSQGAVIVTGDDGTAAFDGATGAVRWTRPDLDTAMTASAAYGLIYLVPTRPGGAEHPQEVVALDGDTGATRWSTPFDVYDSSKPAIANGVVYVGGQDSNLYALDARSGTILTTKPTPGATVLSPTVVNGMVYVADSGGTLSAFHL